MSLTGCFLDTIHTILRLRLSLIIFLLGLSIDAPAQVIEDSTSIDRYYPLDIGNEWIYTGAEEYDKRHTIIGDTMFNERHYFSVERYVPDAALLDTFFTRVDTSGAIVFLRDLLADTLTYPHPLPCDNPNLVFANCIDLRADFGDTLYFDSTSSHAYRVTGSYNESVNIGGIDYDGLTQKCYEIYAAYGTCFIADIGWSFGGSLASYTLHAAAVQSGGWGTFLPDSVDEPERTEFTFQLYPNPAVESIFVSVEPGIRITTIRIFNILGREVLIQNGNSTLISIDVSALPRGEYVVRLEGRYVNIERTFVKL